MMKEKKNKMEIASDQVLIPGIDNYCNRWCERCLFASRCANYRLRKEVIDYTATEKDDFSGGALPGPNLTLFELINQEESFWQFMDLMMKEDDSYMEISKLKGCECPDDVVDFEDVMDHELCRKAVYCYDLMIDWSIRSGKYQCAFLGGNSGDENDNGLEADPIIVNALEVIEWNKSLLLSKVFRAMSAEDSEHLYAVERDANGSMKVAMLAIDDLFDAWCDLLLEIPEAENEIFDILHYLSLLKEEINAKFPLASCFVRPGFDEGME